MTSGFLGGGDFAEQNSPGSDQVTRLKNKGKTLVRLSFTPYKPIFGVKIGTMESRIPPRKSACGSVRDGRRFLRSRGHSRSGSKTKEA
jgi:hypothetical protein